MTNTYTTSSTFTKTNVKYVASKVVADLRGLRAYYGEPDEDKIWDFYEELVELLAGGYVTSVEYGFKRNGQRVVSLYYEAQMDGSLTDGKSGGVYARAKISGASLVLLPRLQQQMGIALSRRSAGGRGTNSHKAQPRTGSWRWQRLLEFGPQLFLARGRCSASDIPSPLGRVANQGDGPSLENEYGDHNGNLARAIRHNLWVRGAKHPTRRTVRRRQLYFRPLGKQLWHPLYIGETQNFAARFQNHEKAPCAQQSSMNQIHYHIHNGNAQVRRAEEQDLNRRWNPPCNG